MTSWREQVVEGWGRFPSSVAACTRPERWSEVGQALTEREGSAILAHGLGRSYGDAAMLANGRIVLTERLDRMLGFDPETGWLRCEGGVSLLDIINIFVPRGFFLPVVPGTQFVTVGGALASDIHGKNHHVEGSFGDHVRRVEMMLCDGRVVICDKDTEPGLFYATVGGMGLTGIILALDVRLTRIANPYIEMETVRVENLDHFFEVSAQSTDWPYTVSWIDCVAQGAAMGRGVFMRGRHAEPGAIPGGQAVEHLKRWLAPVLDVRHFQADWLLNGATIRAFNEVYYRSAPAGVGRTIVGYEPFFFPLDAIQHWNHLYGRRGLLQYQPVVPPDPQHRAMRAILEAITTSGFGSFLAVIKEFGAQQHGGLSFPRPGVTLALDFPNYGPPLLDLLDRLDAIVADAGGRIYLTKDARMSEDRFRQMYPEWQAWKAERDRWDPGNVFSSDLGRRLGLSGFSR